MSQFNNSNYSQYIIIYLLAVNGVIVLTTEDAIIT